VAAEQRELAGDQWDWRICIWHRWPVRQTRRYHGLLLAAFNPPGERKFLVGGFDEVAKTDGKTCELATHRWASGAVAPQGYLALQSFRLDGAIPVWTFLAGSARIEKRVWMQYGENTTLCSTRLLRPRRKSTLK